MSETPETDARFRGGVFSQDLPSGKAGAELSFGPGELRAITSDGRDFSWPYGDIKIELGGASGRLVFCRLAAQPEAAAAFCEQPNFLEGLAEASAGALDSQIADAQASVRESKRSNFRKGLWILGVCAVLLCGLLWALMAGVGRAIDALPISIDQGLGEASEFMIEMQGPAVSDPLLVDTVQAFVSLLEPHVALEGFEFKIHVVQSEIVNAFALPGGNMVVFSGLIAKADRPEQVAGVLGHEMAHVTLRHGLHRISRSLGVSFAMRAILGDADGLLAMGVSAATEATLLGHSREQESAADREGVRMLLAADIEPAGLAEFFALLAEEEGAGSSIPEWFSTHPDHADRIEAIQEQLGETPFFGPPPLAERLDLDWQAIRDRARSITDAAPQQEQGE